MSEQPETNERTLTLSTDELLLFRAFVRVQAAHIQLSIAKGALKNALIPGMNNDELLAFLAKLDLAIARVLGVSSEDPVRFLYPYYGARPKPYYGGRK